MLQDSAISFLLPSYVEVQALVLESMVAPPSWIVSWGYDIGVKTYIDGEAL